MPKSEFGLTLIEVLIAIVIAAVSATVVLQAFAGLARGLTIAERRTAACAFATSKMAELIVAPRQRTGQANLDGGTFRLDDQPFSWQAVAQPLNDEHSLEAVTLTVAWTRGRSGGETVLKTFRYVPEPDDT